MVRVANHPWQRWNSILFVRIVWWWFHRIACVIFWLQIPVSSFHCHLARRCGICQTTCKFPDRGNMNRKIYQKTFDTFQLAFKWMHFAVERNRKHTKERAIFSVALSPNNFQFLHPWNCVRVFLHHFGFVFELPAKRNTPPKVCNFRLMKLKNKAQRVCKRRSVPPHCH